MFSMVPNPLTLIPATLPRPWQKSLYQTQQDLKAALSLGHKRFNAQLRDVVAPAAKPQGLSSFPKAILDEMTQERAMLLEQDWQEGETGIYPLSLLFEDDWEEALQNYSLLWWEQPHTWQRVSDRSTQATPPPQDTTDYPSYYLQAFHYQSNGYLSDNSAALYDLQVELLFNGTADAMRRRILKPLKTRLNSQVKTPKILDVA